jgi:precorrin-2 C20-methyltransferase/precorrin-3B C17-methyltransferase
LISITMSELGTLFGVGLGPGDPELITRKAVRVLTEVDWIFLPAGKKSGASFARRIVEPLNLPQSKFRPISLCMARSRQDDRAAYRQVAGGILSELQQGKSAAWIAEGDPLFYSTFGHILEEIRRRCPSVPIEIVPGVTSLQAAAARAVMPVASLDEKVAVLPAAYGLECLATLLEEFTTVFLIKVHTVFDRLLDQLAGLSVQAKYVENVGTPEERIVSDLESLRGRELPYFSLVMLQSRRASRRQPDVSGHLHIGLTLRPSPGTIFVVGLGPGRRDLLTAQAREALAQSEAIVGYSGYFEAIADLVVDKECHCLPLGQERERSRLAVELAAQGKTVAVISSGDPGIYAMAGIVLEAVEQTSEVSKTSEVCVIPGISAINAVAALLGAPLGHDFAVISLSDLLTPWETIEKRLQGALSADFVVVLLNPKSQGRDWQLGRAREILLGKRDPTTPVGWARNAFRPGQEVCVTTLQELNDAEVDMFTTVIVGNTQTRRLGKHLITPRKYQP